MRRPVGPEPQKRGESVESAPLPSLGPRVGNRSAGAERGAAGIRMKRAVLAWRDIPNAALPPPHEPAADDSRSLVPPQGRRTGVGVAEAAFRGLASDAELKAQLEGNEGNEVSQRYGVCSISPAAQSGHDRAGSERCFACFVGLV